MGNGNEKGYIGVYSGIQNIKPVSSLKRRYIPGTAFNMRSGSTLSEALNPCLTLLDLLLLEEFRTCPDHVTRTCIHI